MCNDNNNNADDGDDKVFFIQLISIANDRHQNPH